MGCRIIKEEDDRFQGSILSFEAKQPIPNAKHQWTTLTRRQFLYFLKTSDLLDYFKLNIEANQWRHLPAHTFEHELAVASAAW